MALDVKVNINFLKPAGRFGFGHPLILEEHAETAIPYAEVEELGDVITAGFGITTTVYQAAQLMFAQNTPPKKISVCAVTGTALDALADTSLTQRGWRQLIVVSGGETKTSVSDIMRAVEALDIDLYQKMYFASLPVNDTTALSVEGINRTVLFYCDATAAAPVPEAALVGETASREPGSFTYKNMILKGIKPQELTDAQLTAIHRKGGITFVTKAGDNVTSEGKVAGGEYIDIIDSEDYIIQQLEYKTQKMLNNTAKVPYDDTGIAMLESVAVDVLQTAYNNGMIATVDGGPQYEVAYALRADTTEEDRVVRKYLGGKFSFVLAGAIHEAVITGTITV